MKHIIFSCILILASCASSVLAGELSPLALDHGENRIVLALVNTTGADITGVSASVDGAKFPEWLSVQCGTGAVDAPKGARAQEKLFLMCTVKDVPAGAEAVVPITLRNILGKTWSYTVAVRVNASRPLPDAIIGNCPNPFNPDTSISFSLAENRRVSLVVYNSLGQKVRTLVDGHLAAGKHTARWDGRDDAGRRVSSGVYICVMTAGHYRNTVKMLFAQ